METNSIAIAAPMANMSANWMTKSMVGTDQASSLPGFGSFGAGHPDGCTRQRENNKLPLHLQTLYALATMRKRPARRARPKTAPDATCRVGAATP